MIHDTDWHFLKPRRTNGFREFVRRSLANECSFEHKCVYRSHVHTWGGRRTAAGKDSLTRLFAFGSVSGIEMMTLGFDSEKASGFCFMSRRR